MPKRNLLLPFTRDRKADFASGDGAALRRAQIEQVLLTDGTTATTQGELLWRTGFGAGLSLLRHQPNDEVNAELARVSVRDALARWMPNVSVERVDVRRDGGQMTLRVVYTDRVSGERDQVELQR